jgi:glycosyltransferase involved in cell wall biosynthesis
MQKLILLFSTNLLACGKEAAIYLFGRKKVETGKTLIIKNSVNVNDFKVNGDLRREIRNDLGLKEELVICHIGRFTAQKNHEFLINLFQKVNEKLPQSILLLIGEGDLKPTIENKVISSGLSSSVKFLGERKDIPMVLQGVDLFILPSLYEGFPVVLIEAQAAGLNCVVSDAITNDIDLTGGVNFIGLNDSIEKWVDEIVSLTPTRVDTTKVMKLKGFDNKTNAKMLSDVYLGEI